MNLALLLVLFCSDPTNLSQCKIDPYDTEIAISGNSSGSTCIGWTGKIGDKDVFQTSFKDPDLNWSTPETLFTSEPEKEIQSIHIKVNAEGKTYALWEQNWDEECVSDVLSSHRYRNASWEPSTCLLENIFETGWRIGLGNDGYGHFVPMDGNLSISAKTFYEAVSSDRIPSNYSHYDRYLSSFYADQNKAVASWTRQEKNQCLVEYAFFRNGVWSNINQLGRVPSSKRKHYCIIGPNEDALMLELPFFEGEHLLVSIDSSQPDHLFNLGKENDIIRMPTFATDEQGNLCIVWEYERERKWWIGVAYKPYGQNWLETRELSPLKGLYRYLTLSEGINGTFVVAFEHQTKRRNATIQGFSIDQAGISPVKQLSPEGQNCSSPSLFISKSGQGYIAWINEEDRNVIQAAELYLK